MKKARHGAEVTASLTEIEATMSNEFQAYVSLFHQIYAAVRQYRVQPQGYDPNVDYTLNDQAIVCLGLHDTTSKLIRTHLPRFRTLVAKVQDQSRETESRSLVPHVQESNTMPTPVKGMVSGGGSAILQSFETCASNVGKGLAELGQIVGSSVRSTPLSQSLRLKCAHDRSS
jgi:hypothetical protein